MFIKNSIKSEDGQIFESYKDIKQVCICYSLYPLLQYLLLMDEEIIKKHTYYFFGSEVAYNIRCHLPNSCFETRPAETLLKKIRRIIKKLSLRKFKDYIYPFLKNAEIFAQDFGYLSILIGSRSYSMLQEAPNHLNYVGQEDSAEFQRLKRKSKSLKGRIESFLYGSIATGYDGNNSQCKALFLTEETSAVVTQNKIIQVDSLKSLWEKSSESKRKFILSVFDLTDDDTEFLAKYPILFLSQPWVNDHLIKEDDYVSLLKESFEYYDQKEIIIKCHPRDTFEYEKYFPDIHVFSKPINMQLLMLVAFNTKKVVTFSSSAVDCLPENIEIDWFGTPIHKLEREIDDIPFIFNRAYNKINWKI